ncbi:MAG: rhomboid family intramembrane serine protease [Armatimonadetes bacterium]|nr:rhomboid family intramembrane serine protease [Armatimonadota bacterium]
MPKPGPFDSIVRFYRRSGMPVTLIAIAATVMSLVLSWFFYANLGFVSNLAFVSDNWYFRPWTLLTYTVIAMDFLGVLFICIGLFYFTGALERLWGTRKFAAFFVATILACPLALFLGYLIEGTQMVLTSLGFAVACSVVAYAALFPNHQILLWFVLPVAAKWIGWITALGTVFYYGSGGHPLVGFLAAIPLVLAWAFATGRLRLPSIPERRTNAGMRDKDYRGHDYDKRMETEAERRRLKELFERSLKEDPEKDDDGRDVR